MKAGGYEDERWWDTEAAQAWRRGEGTAEGAKQQWREDRQTLQTHFDDIRNWHRQGRITSKQADDWEQIARMDDDEFEALLEEWYPPGRQTQPAYWNDDAFDNPAQPVVGVCWFEARAYCAWLSAQTGQPFRLPTEAEWEAAARGPSGTALRLRRRVRREPLQRLRDPHSPDHARRRLSRRRDAGWTHRSDGQYLGLDRQPVPTLSLRRRRRPGRPGGRGPPGGARRLLELQPVQRARRLPQLLRARQPQQPPRFSAGAGVPHLRHWSLIAA